MIVVNKMEKDYIVSRCPGVHIVRTMKQKSKRHKYYCEESPRVMNCLNRFRGIDITENKKDGGYYKHRKNAKRVGA